MTYQGYMALANDDGETLELVNASRVKAYTDNLAPSIGLRGCDDCEGLDEALGETYTNPVADNAPWYDPTDPATANFYGVYPLAFEGVDDSTRTIESAELTGDGSVVVGSRFAGKDIRVSGMAFAKDEAALYAGVSWLDSALNGTEEGRCFGDRLDLFSSCPPVEVLPPDFAEPYTLVVPPDAAELAAWTTTSGPITGDAEGVNFEWDDLDTVRRACREITGLIPGEQYQLRMRMESYGDYFVRIGTSCDPADTDYQTIFGFGTSHNPPTDPTVLDFIPRTTSVFLSITPTGSTDVTNLQVQNALVRRVIRPGVITFGTGDDAVPPSDGWTHLAPAGARVEWVLDDTNTITTAQAPFAGGLTYTAAHGPERTLFGLTPGSRYRLMVEFDAIYFASDSDPGTTLVPRVTITNTSSPVVTYTDDNLGTFQYFWVIEFTADSTSSTLHFHPDAALPLGSYGFARWTFQQYMVEEILETDEVPPQPGRFQERTMYQVKASQGPILTEVRTSPCGVMGRISYSLRAGNPFKYRRPIFAGGLPTGTSVLTPDIPCSEDGLAQIINFNYNPSLEEVGPIANTWLGGGSNPTFNGRVASPTARLGGWVYRLTADAAGSINAVNNYYFPSLATGGPVPQSGETLTVSGYVRAIAAGSLGMFEMNCFITMTGFPSFSSDDFVNVTVLNQWYRFETTFTLPDNVTLDGIETGFFAPPDVAAAVGMEVDAVMIQRGSVATEPFDQTSENVVWSAAANASALLLTPVAEDISEDPDCPTPPAPPAPPEIEDACITEPSAYNRTVVAVSEDTVPRNLTAYPVITLTAGATAVRQARIRFWANPDNLTIDEIYPCDYDGEIIVSYLAAGATMIIDGVLREATVSAPGFDPVNANHILYGAGGGPVDWPELTGGIPYLVTLELDSSASYSDTIMLIDLVVRD